MKPLFKVLKLNKHSFFETHLAFINCILPESKRLTPTEVKVLSRFMALEGDISRDRFGESARKIVKQDCKISTGGLSNYMRAFREKGILNTEGQIKSVFFPTDKFQEYNFKLIIDEATN